MIDRHRARLELDLAGLDLGDIEDVIDQGQEVPAALLDVFQGAEVFRVQGTIDLFLEPFSHDENAVEGSP